MLDFSHSIQQLAIFATDIKALIMRKVLHFLLPVICAVLGLLLVGSPQSQAQGKRWKQKQYESLQDSVNFYIDKGLYKDGLRLAEEMMILVKTSFDDMRKREDYHDITLKNLIQLYEYNAKYKKVISLYDYAIELTKESLGEKHPDYAALLNGKGLAMDRLVKYDEAIYNLEQAKDLRQEIFGINSPEYIESVANIGGVYSDMGEFDKAATYFSEADNVAVETFGEKDPMRAYQLDNLGLFYEATGDFKKAKNYYERGLDIRKKQDASKMDLATSLDLLGQFYFNTGSYDSAMAYYEEALKIKEKQLDKQHPEYIHSLESKAELLEYMGATYRSRKTL